MSEQRNTSLRVEAEALARADALIAAVAADPTLRDAGVTVTRSTVLRLALSRGLALIEAEAAASAEEPRR